MIFISYRRADSDTISQQVYDHLVNYFGDDMITMDVDTFKAGIDFREQITDFIRQSDIVLAVIGPRWVRELQQQENKPHDYLRIELELAMNMSVTVIPLLVLGAEVPNTSQLPDSLQQLTYKNALEVRGESVSTGEMERVIQKIEDTFIHVWDQKDRERRAHALQSTGEDRRANAERMKIIVGRAPPETTAYWRNSAKILSQWAPIRDNVLGQETKAKLEDLVRNVYDAETRLIALRGLAGLPYQLGDERRLRVSGYAHYIGMI
jgi:TIR domain